MKLIALEKEKPALPEEAFVPYLEAEAGRAWELYQAGVLRELYFRADKVEAVLILECAGVDEARAILDTLPLVEAGLISFEVIPLRPYDGFARLFAS